MTTTEISVQELASLRETQGNLFILDVRNPDEFALCNIDGYLMPLNELQSRISELDPDDYIVVHCHAGGRSRKATDFLIQQGFKTVFNLTGGITAWANEIDPSMPKY